MSDQKSPREIVDMRSGLADARREARGVKDSARGLRRVPKSERLSRLTDEEMAAYDKQHPPTPPSDDTTRRTTP